MREFFKAEDFKYIDPMSQGYSDSLCERLAGKANELLKERGIMVYGQHKEHWNSFTNPSDTHTALLINIQPIEEKKVKVTRKQLEKALGESGEWMVPIDFQFNKPERQPMHRISLDKICEKLGL